ncbi:hypothetical protein BR93DRAFT_516196 [Coniochaeta sp. PMI_546]|nr:hypothetical protein BR93DRAFT_516196 [Coniochaeta sp. PMI_546]
MRKRGLHFSMGLILIRPWIWLQLIEFVHSCPMFNDTFHVPLLASRQHQQQKQQQQHQNIALHVEMRQRHEWLKPTVCRTGPCGLHHKAFWLFGFKFFPSRGSWKPRDRYL